MTRNLFFAAALAGLASCHNNPSTDPASARKDPAMTDHAAMKMGDSSMSGHTAQASKPDLKSLHFDYAKDPSCGMPLRAGLEDTTHYKGKLYGFCSRECKEAFLKDPASYLAQVK